MIHHHLFQVVSDRLSVAGKHGGLVDYSDPLQIFFNRKTFRVLSFEFGIELFTLLFAGYIFYYNKTALLAKLAVLSIVCNVIFNYFLIGRFGAMGAAYSTTLSFFIVFIIVAVQANKLVKLPWFQKHTFRLKS